MRPNERPKIGDVVAVEWLDAWCDADDTRPSDWKDSHPLTTYGVLRRDGDIVTVVGEPGEDNIGRSTTHIPRAIVTRIRVLHREA